MILGTDAAFFSFFSSTLDFGWIHMGYHDTDSRAGTIGVCRSSSNVWIKL
jgi:hypothetical protein